MTDPIALSMPQTSRTELRIGRHFALTVEVAVTPLGLLSVGALVAGILLSVPPIIHAGGKAAERLPDKAAGGR